MVNSIRKKKDPDYKAFIRRIITLSVSVVAVFLLTLFNYFLPFTSFRPAYAIAPREEGELRIHFLSVGQGDATVVEFPDGDCLLIDAGDGSFVHNNHIYRYLKGLNFKNLSAVISHADVDHCGGMAEVLSAFNITTLYLPVVGSQSGYYSNSVAQAEESGIKLQTLYRYQSISMPSGAYLVCISPYSIEESGDNDASVVLYLSYKNTTVLFGADISSVRERRLVSEYQSDPHLFNSENLAVNLSGIDLLKVSHHGSAGSCCKEWLELLDPKTAVISCGEDNAYRHPAAQMLARISVHTRDIYRTDELGDVVVSITEKGYHVEVGKTE